MGSPGAAPPTHLASPFDELDGRQRQDFFHGKGRGSGERLETCTASQDMDTELAQSFLPCSHCQRKSHGRGKSQRKGNTPYPSRRGNKKASWQRAAHLTRGSFGVINANHWNPNDLRSRPTPVQDAERAISWVSIASGKKTKTQFLEV